MLRITTSTSAEDAKKYFRNAQALEAYYSEGQEFAGYWGGKAAAMLGLQGSMKHKEFEMLCDNINPVTGQRLTQRNDRDRRPGFDFNFNVPKSVSLAYFYKNDERILQAVRQSALMVMEEIESEMKTRVRVHGADEDRITGNLVFAEFVHLTSRPVKGVPDPHLHLHMYVMNATFDPVEQKWKAAQIGDIKEKAEDYQAMFFSHLSKMLEEIGYEVEQHGKFFGLKDVPVSLTKKFSRRTQVIEEAALELGIKDATEKDKLAALTREYKTSEILIPELKPIWWECLTPDEKTILNGLGRGLERFPLLEAIPLERSVQAFGLRTDPIGETAKAFAHLSTVVAEKQSHLFGELNAEQINQRSWSGSRNRATRPVVGYKPDYPVTQDDLRAVALATEHLLERRSVVTKRELTKEAIHSWGYGSATVSGITKVIDAAPFIRREIDGETYLTTQQVLAEEDCILDLCIMGKSRFEPINPRWKNQDDALTQEQKDAIALVLNSKDFIVGVRGLPGVGKTRLMRELDEAVRAGFFGSQVLSTWAVTAHDTLKKDGFDKAETIAKFIHSERLQAQCIDGVLLVDEAGLLSTRLAAPFLAKAREIGARVVLIGDTGQHHAVDRGQVFKLLEKHGGMAVAEVTRIQRQRNPEYRKFVQEFATGQIDQALDRLLELEAFVEGPTEKIVQAFANDYATALKSQKTISAVSPTHAGCDYSTEVLRERLKQEKLLTDGVRWSTLRQFSRTDAQKIDPQKYHPGEVVKINGHIKGFRRDEMVEVVAVRDGVVRVRCSELRLSPMIKGLPLSEPRKLTVFERKEIEVCAGESIRMTGKGESVQGHVFENGSEFKVDYITHDGRLSLENGWLIEKNFPHLTHAWVSTSHVSQGKTVDIALLFQTEELSNAATERNQVNVSTSRGRDWFRVYTTDIEWFCEAAKREREQKMAMDIVVPDRTYPTEPRPARTRDLLGRGLSREPQTAKDLALEEKDRQTDERSLSEALGQLRRAAEQAREACAEIAQTQRQRVHEKEIEREMELSM